MTTPHRRILYIEDHEDTRDLVVLVLQERDYDVMTGETIKAALKLAQETKFDLYLLDSWLPDGSGIDLCKKIREFDGHTPIIFYSAAAYEADKELAYATGAQAYLTKPCSFNTLCELIEKLMSSASSDGEKQMHQPNLTHLQFSPEPES